MQKAYSDDYICVMEHTIQAQHCFFDVAALCPGDSGIMMQQAIIIYITAAAAAPAAAAGRGSMPLMHTTITTSSLITSLSLTVIKGPGASSIYSTAATITEAMGLVAAIHTAGPITGWPLELP